MDSCAFAKKFNFLIPVQLQFLTFPQAATQKISFVNFDFYNFFYSLFFRKILSFFQNRQNEIRQILRYFENFILDSHILKTSHHISFTLFCQTQVSFVRKHNFFHNFGPPEVELNKSSFLDKLQNWILRN